MPVASRQPPPPMPFKSTTGTGHPASASARESMPPAAALRQQLLVIKPWGSSSSGKEPRHYARGHCDHKEVATIEMLSTCPSLPQSLRCPRAPGPRGGGGRGAALVRHDLSWQLHTLPSAADAHPLQQQRRRCHELAAAPRTQGSSSSMGRGRVVQRLVVSSRDIEQQQARHTSRHGVLLVHPA